MKRKVRIRKAQFGGMAALQETAPQTQISDEQVVDAVIRMSQNGQDTDYILKALVSAGVEQERAVAVIQGLQDTVAQQQELEVAQDEQDTDTINELEAEQVTNELEAQEELQRQQQLADLYGYNESAYDDGAAEEDYGFVENNLMRYGGMSSKRAFMRKVLKDIKAQEGMQMQQNSADPTDTGERASQLNNFLGSVKSSGDEALMKKDAEAMYNMMPEAQLGMNMRPGQERRMMRRMNRAIGRIPIPVSAPGFPMPFNIVTAPMMGGFSDYKIPAYGSYYGGPRMANIDVRRTGLFGRPKEYTITFAQEAYYKPRMQEDIYRLEERNVEETVKETETDQKAKDTETKTDSNKEVKDTAGNSTVTSKPVSNNTTVTVPAAGNKKGTSQSIYSNANTPSDMLYYNPDKPGYSYGYIDGNLYYDDNLSDGFNNPIQITDPERVAQLNKKLKGADLFTLPAKPGYYYRQRPDGAFAKFQGDPAKHSTSSKQIGVIKPGDPNYTYVQKNAQYKTSYAPTKQTSSPASQIFKDREAERKAYGNGLIKQQGGFVDPFNPMLQKFVYGGIDNMALPEVQGKLTDSPYFQDGGEENSEKKNKRWEDLTDEEKAKLIKAYEEEKARVNRNSSSLGYNSYSPNVFPGGFAKQRGLPYDPYTGQRLYKGFDPSTMSSNLSYIDVTKTRLSGAPKKYTMYFGHYDPTQPFVSPGSRRAGEDTWTRRDDRQRTREGRQDLRETLGKNYKVGQFFQNLLDADNDRSPRLRNWIDQKRSERLKVPFLNPKAYGGLPKAEMAGQSPFVRDPRFSPIYTDNPEFMGMSDIDLITPNATGVVPDAVSAMGDWYTPVASSTSDIGRSEADIATDPSMTVDPNQPNRQMMERNKLKDPWAVDLKLKNSNAENLRALGIVNAGIDVGLSALGERGDVDRMRQMYDQMTADALYGSTNISDRGTYETNSGLFRPDEMGFKGVVQYGGDLSSYKEGGETFMSEDQIRKFLEEGGELEFI